MSMGLKNISLVDLVVDAKAAQTQLSRAQQLADRIDRTAFLVQQSLIQCATIAGATVIPAANQTYVDAAGKPFGPIT